MSGRKEFVSLKNIIYNDGNWTYSVSFGVIESGGRLAKEGGELENILGIKEVLEEYSSTILFEHIRFKNNNIRYDINPNNFIIANE